MTTILGRTGCAGHPQGEKVPAAPQARRRAPSPIDVLDAIDMQLVADSDEVVLTRDHAQLLAALLTDLLNPRGPVRRGTRAPEAHTQQQRRTA